MKNIKIFYQILYYNFIKANIISVLLNYTYLDIYEGLYVIYGVV